MKTQITSWAKAFDGKNSYLYARATILSQEVFKNKLWNISITKKQWVLVKKGIAEEIKRGVKIWDIIRKARILKRVQVQ